MAQLLLSINPATGLAPITMATSIEDGGITFNFSRAVPTVTSVGGRKAVLSTEAASFDIISTSPASAVIGGADANGMMENPYILTGSPDQGFEEYLATGGGSFAVLPYDDTLNVDPGNTGSPITITQGMQKSFVKAKRKTGKVTDSLEWDTIESYGELHILSAQPPVDFFMPSASATTKRIFSLSDVDLSVFRSLTLASTFGSNPTAMASTLPINAGNWGAVGEIHRRFRLDSNQAAAYAPANYAADISVPVSQACAMLHDSRYTQTEKNPLLYRMIEWGIQLDGLWDRGWRGIGSNGGGAGQSGGWLPYYYVAAFALQDTQMISRLVDVRSMFNNAFWVTAANINELNSGLETTNEGDVGLPFRPEHIDTPGTNAVVNLGGNFERRYDAISAGMMANEAVPIALLTNDPVSNRDGLSVYLDGATGTSSFKTAAIAMVDRVSTINLWPSSGRPVGEGAMPTVWKTDIDPLGVIPAYTQGPEEIHHGSDPTYGDGFFTAEARGYSFNFSAYNYALETKTDWESRYSLDGVQFVEVTHLSDTDTVAGLLPVAEHYLGFRFGSASGMAPWSSNFQSVAAAGIGEINKVTTLQGAASSPTAPSFTVNPVIHGSISERSRRAGYWEPLSGAIDAKYITLSCGAGYVDGDEVPTFTYQWNRNGSPIVGETSKEYARTRDDSGATITCTITPSNATSGEGTAYTTAGITSPVVAPLPDTKLTDTDFGELFAVDYSTELANASGNNVTIDHVPYETFGSFSEVGGALEGVNTGALRFNKQDAYCSARLPLRNTAKTDTTYTVIFEIVMGCGELPGQGFGSDPIPPGVDFIVSINNVTLGSAPLTTGFIFPPTNSAPFSYTLTGTFDTNGVTGAALSDYEARIYLDTPTGGEGASDMYMTRLLVEEVV